MRVQRLSPHNFCTRRWFATTRSIYARQGFISFWNGNLANCIRAVPKFALDMAIKDEIFAALERTRQFDTNQYSWQLLASLISGATAALVSTVLLYPLDMARTRMAADVDEQPQFSGIFDCWRQVYNSQGVTALYRGLWVSLMGDVLYRGLMYGIYDGFRPFILDSMTNESDGAVFIVDWLYGWLVSAAVATILMPVDTGRRILMSDRIKFDSKTCNRDLIHEPRYRGFWNCMRSLVKEHGFARLWNGEIISMRYKLTV